MFVFLFFLCIQTLWSEYKSLIRYIFCKYLLLLYGLFFYFINHAFFLYQTQLYTSVTVSAVQQSKSAIHIRALVAQLCPTLCDPMDCNPPYSSVHVILQAKLLEWVSMPFSRGLSQPQGSNPGLLYCQWILYHLTTRETRVCPVLGVSSPFRSP